MGAVDESEDEAVVGAAGFGVHQEEEKGDGKDLLEDEGGHFLDAHVLLH